MYSSLTEIVNPDPGELLQYLQRVERQHSPVDWVSQLTQGVHPGDRTEKMRTSILWHHYSKINGPGLAGMGLLAPWAGWGVQVRLGRVTKAY